MGVLYHGAGSRQNGIGGDSGAFTYRFGMFATFTLVGFLVDCLKDHHINHNHHLRRGGKKDL